MERTLKSLVDAAHEMESKMREIAKTRRPTDEESAEAIRVYRAAKNATARFS